QKALDPPRERGALLSCLSVAFRDGGVLVVDETCDRSVELTVKRQEIGLVPAHERAPITDSRPGFEDAFLGLDEVTCRTLSLSLQVGVMSAEGLLAKGTDNLAEPTR